MYANKIYNLKWSRFLERSKLPRLDHKEIENLNRIATSKNIKSVIKNFPTKKSPVPVAFPGEFCYTLKDLIPILFSLSENWRGHNTSKVISLVPKPDKDNTRKQNCRPVPNLPASVGDTRDMGSIKDPLEEEMANHSSILARWATVHGVAESDMTEDAPLMNVEIKIIKKIPAKRI